MQPSDVVEALAPLVAVLDALDATYYVGGSIASALHGVPRTSVDVDLVVALRDDHVSSLVRALERDYYLDEARIRDAVQRRRFFNVIHLATMLKVDIFVAKERPFDAEALRRASPQEVSVGSGDAFRVASAEDILLAKLEWYRAGGETSERQWTDVLGLLRVQEDRLDRAYARHWASVLGVLDLLERAEEER